MPICARRSSGDSPYFGVDASPSCEDKPRAAAADTASRLLPTDNLLRMADTWWSTVLGDTTRRSAISEFVRCSQSRARTSSSRVVSPAELACVVARGPRGTVRAPISRRRRPTWAARGRAPSRCRISSDRRRSSSLELSPSASASSYGHPRSCQTAADFAYTCRPDGEGKAHRSWSSRWALRAAYSTEQPHLETRHPLATTEPSGL